MIDEALSAAHAALSIAKDRRPIRSPRRTLCSSGSTRRTLRSWLRCGQLGSPNVNSTGSNRPSSTLRDAIALGTMIGERVLLAQVSSALVVVFGHARQTGRSARARRVGRRPCARLRHRSSRPGNAASARPRADGALGRRHATRTPPHCRSSGPTATPCSRLAFVATEPWSTHFRAASRKRSPIRRSPSGWPRPASSTSSRVARRTTTRSPPGSRATS